MQVNLYAYACITSNSGNGAQPQHVAQAANRGKHAVNGPKSVVE